MYSFSVDLINGLNSTEKLANAPIDNVPLYSSLDILINCLKGNFLQALQIQHYPDEQIHLIDYSESAIQPYLASPLDQQKSKEEFFSKCFHNGILVHRVPTGVQKEINDTQFHILSNAIKNSDNLKTIWLLLTLSLTEYQEKELVAVLSENPSITSVRIDGCISSSTINAMQAISKQRSELKIIIDGAITSTNNIPEAIKHNQEKIQRLSLAQTECNTTAQKIPGLTNMHLMQGFIAVMGAAAIATAFVLLHAATLNPLGIIIAAAGGATLTYSAYSFFASGSSESSKNIIPNNLIPAM